MSVEPKYNKNNQLIAFNNKDNAFYLNIKTWLTDNGLSLVGGTLTLKVKTELIGGSTLLTQTQSTHEDAANGISIIKIPKATMDGLADGVYYYQLLLTTTTPETFTIQLSDFILSQSIKL